MRRIKKLTKEEAHAGARIGRRLADTPFVEHMTEGDILDVVDIATNAIGLADEKFYAFKMKVYKTILEKKPDYENCLVEEFLSEIRESE